MTQVERGLGEATVDDVPDMRPRPLPQLAEWVSAAAVLRDTARYGPSGDHIDAALIELQAHVAIATGRARQQAVELLAHASYHAFVLATTFGYLHLARQAASRAGEAATLAERAELQAFAMFARARRRWHAPAAEVVQCGCSNAVSPMPSH